MTACAYPQNAGLQAKAELLRSKIPAASETHRAQLKTHGGDKSSGKSAWKGRVWSASTPKSGRGLGDKHGQWEFPSREVTRPNSFGDDDSWDEITLS